MAVAEDDGLITPEPSALAPAADTAAMPAANADQEQAAVAAFAVGQPVSVRQVNNWQIFRKL